MSSLTGITDAPRFTGETEATEMESNPVSYKDVREDDFTTASELMGRPQDPLSRSVERMAEGVTKCHVLADLQAQDLASLKGTFDAFLKALGVERKEPRWHL